MFDKYSALFHAWPVLTTLATCFYVLLILIIIKPLRQWIKNTLSMPISSTGRNFTALDAFRGFSALGVACIHAWQWSKPQLFDPVVELMPLIQHGAKAVPVFCLLSGFLITRSLRSARTIDDLRHYAIRRILRIFPLYFIIYIFFLIYCVDSIDLHLVNLLPGEFLMLRAVGSVGFPVNNPIAPISPTWSLYVEVLFYMVMPIIVIVSRKRLLFVAVIFFLAFSMYDIIATSQVALWKYFFLGTVACEITERYGNHIHELAWMIKILSFPNVIITNL